MLRNETYIGNLLFNRRSQRLGGKSRSNPPDKWIRCNDAIEPIVDKERFISAQRILASPTRHKTDEQVLAALRNFSKMSGRLSKATISASREVPGPKAIRRRFGGLRSAYALIGHPPPKYYGELRDNENIRCASAKLESDVAALAQSTGASVRRIGLRVFSINEHFNLRITIAAATRGRRGSAQWRVLLKVPFHYDLIIAARMNPSNIEIADYYFLPRYGFAGVTISLGTENGLRHNQFRKVSLQPLSLFFNLRKQGKAFPQKLEEFKALFVGA